jgi:hypothetical protein
VRTTRVAIAAALALVGLLWIGQGLGFVPGSVMSGDPLWAVVGAGLLLVAGALVAREMRRG